MPFKPGQSGNPSGRRADGRPRQRLAEAFLNRLRADFEKHGIQAIQDARERDPMGYVRMIAGLLPQEAKINVEHSFADVLVEAQRLRAIQQKPAAELPTVIEGEAVKVQGRED
jgi:hypothetical protein